MSTRRRNASHCRTCPDVEWLEDRSVPSVLGLVDPTSTLLSAPVPATAQQSLSNTASTSTSGSPVQTHPALSLLTTTDHQVTSPTGAVAALNTVIDNLAATPTKTAAPLTALSGGPVSSPMVAAVFGSSSAPAAIPAASASFVEALPSLSESAFAANPSMGNFSGPASCTGTAFTLAGQSSDDPLLLWLDAAAQDNAQAPETPLTQPAAVDVLRSLNTLEPRNTSVANLMTANGGTATDQSQPAAADEQDGGASADGGAQAVADDVFAERGGTFLGGARHRLAGQFTVPLGPLANFVPRIFLPSSEGQRPLPELGQEPAEVDWVTLSSWGLLLTAAAAAHAVATRQARPVTPVADLHGDWSHGPY